MKKWFLGFIAIICLVLVGCSKKTDEKTYYDDKFMSSLAKGLESRWAYTDSCDDESKEFYTTAIKKELDEIGEYSNLSFKDSKLQEEAIAYINSLKECNKVAQTFGADSFYEKWFDAYDNRTEVLNKINKIKKIKVSKANQKNLDELLASGKEVQNNNNAKEQVLNLINSLSFAKNEEDSFEEYAEYTATVTNNTEFTIEDLSVVAKLKNDQGVVVDEEYLSLNNWTPSETRQVEFGTDKTFSTIEYSIDYIEIKDN
ncbi:hypothetical protein GPZ88_08630 [Streptococcus ruminicola]|uniref:Uncharacterized protein n=1 Tax=Streptococcus ruminicola TaxID=2686210 RepID=A0A6G8I1Q3_9STRE|nr:FxLYD domain-containing protein [Streptococcus ruminicola]QIM47094.1 hypothetical protein GPZ88_08630 [Streptococcus ruminicola]